MGDSPDDEALARELHRELNVGPRRRQRRQAAPPNRSNIPQKRARSAGSSSRDSTTNDDSDEFSDRVNPRSAPKPGQRRGSEPKEDGQVESMHKAVGPLQRSQTAPNPSTVDVGATAGAADAPKAAVPTILLPKPDKHGPSSIAPKSQNLALVRKHTAPAGLKQSTPPKSPRPKKPKTSPPTAVKSAKDTHHARPAVLLGSHKTAPQQAAAGLASQKSIAGVKESLGSKSQVHIKEPGPPKHPSKIIQAGAPAVRNACHDATHRDGHSATAAHKPGSAHTATTSMRVEKPSLSTVAAGKNIQASVLLSKPSAGNAPAAIAANATRKFVADKPVAEENPRKVINQKAHSKVNEQKQISDGKAMAVTHDRKSDFKSNAVTGPRLAAFSPVAEQATSALPEQQAASSPKTVSPTHRVSTTPPKWGAAVPKAFKSVQQSVTVAPHVPEGAQQPTVVADPAKPGIQATIAPALTRGPSLPKSTEPIKPEVTSTAQAVEQIAQKEANYLPQTAASSAKTGGARNPAAPVTTAAWSEECTVAVPTQQTESPKAAVFNKGRPDVASAGSTPRAPGPEQTDISDALQHQERHGAESRGAADKKHMLDDTVHRRGASQIKAEVGNIAAARALESSMDAKNEAFDLMNLCPAHSEVGSLICQETGGDFCVWLRADDISSRAQLGITLSTMYPRVLAASIESSKLDITLVNLRGKQYFHFPANTEFAVQGNVPWQEATAQATHMLLTV